MKALVTGAAGFIGSHLTELLLEEGHAVVALDDFSSGQRENLASVADHPQLQLAVADICDMQALRPWFADVDWVFHLAGKADIVPSIEQPELYFSSNVQGTLQVLQCARAAGAKRFVYAASSSCYGIPAAYPTPEDAPMSPQYPYALTKYLGEQLVLHWAQVYRLPTLSLRLFNVYGARARSSGSYGAVFGVFLAQKLCGAPFTVVGDGTQTRDFTYVSDVARAFLCAARSEISGQIFNVGSGGHYSVNQLVQLLGGPTVHIPKRPGEPDCTFADTRRIRRILGWEPKISFAQGVTLLLHDIGAWQDAPLWTVDRISEATKSWFHYLGESRAC